MDTNSSLTVINKGFFLITAGSRDVPPNTPNISNLDEELAKEGKKQENNLKEHLETVAQNPNLKISAKAKKSTPKHLNFSNLISPSSTKNKVIYYKLDKPLKLFDFCMYVLFMY